MTTAMSPPGSPASGIQRPQSMLIRSKRSSSRMSVSGRPAASTRTSEDEEKKTAVKVALRVRPPVRSTDPGYHLIPQRFRSSTVQVTGPTNLSVESAQGKKLFIFDRVFGEEVDQDGIWDYLGESIPSFVQGYNVTIMAYGQSGAGKSYTMGTSGSEEQADARIMGIVPRAATSLFEKLAGPASRIGIRSPTRYSVNGLNGLMQIQNANEKNWQLTATYVEIYQEQLRDLLLDESVPAHERPRVVIRQDSKGRIMLTGLKEVPINSVDELLNALNLGSELRQTDATAINARSSRSHAVFSLNLVQKKSQPTSVKDKRRSMPLEAMSPSAESWVTLDSKLHFVDLAGSERLKNTGAQGERQKEGISINAGLATLGKVIGELSKKQLAHVSYRDSLLTRMLQDSLGGNAITYMIACVNPAEFHLSETLNTIQYAQRARAIQSRPEIQQSTDESDKQAVIEGLKHEIVLLRDQISLAQQSPEKMGLVQRNQREIGREIELQNRLMDLQENYAALSQRHTRLITDMAKSQEIEDDDKPRLHNALGESAAERLMRSNNFAQAVEEIVQEYETTIQSLGTSLSNTRAILSTKESQMMEEESRMAYIESVNNQLQARVRKAMDRENNDSSYLTELETRVAGATTGEERNNAIIASLRKELARARETEISSEEYISTLEERMAESEQGNELMQREVERLEHVVERQRSLGRLDNLLHELDDVRQPDAHVGAHAVSNGHPAAPGDTAYATPQKQALINGSDHIDGEYPSVNGNVEKVESFRDVDGEVQPTIANGTYSATPQHTDQHLGVRDTEELTSPAQSKFMADKLEIVNGELCELRDEHETTLQHYDELQAKYQVALQTLAEVQDDIEESRRSRHSIILPSTAAIKTHPQRSLSSELARIGELEDGMTDGEGAAVQAPDALAVDIPSQREEQLVRHIEQLKEHHEEKDAVIADMSRTHSQLNEKHQDMLDYVEALKNEISRMQMSGRSSPTPQIIRRKSSQPLPSDRATRSFAALRNMALENFENQPNKIQAFELNVNAALSELHLRAERVTSLEAEVASLRKEMDAKMALITGLTRERSSLKSSSPLDVSLVSSLQSQLLTSEGRMRELGESHAARERELLDQLEALKASPTTPDVPSSTVDMPGAFLETPAKEYGPSRQLGYDGEGGGDQQTHEQLQREMLEWRSKHNAVLASAQASEAQLLATIEGLRASRPRAEDSHETASVQSDSERTVDGNETAATSTVNQHQIVIDALHREIDNLRTSAVANSQQLAILQDSHANVTRQVEEDSASKTLTQKELQTHRELVANLDSQLQQHKSVIATHDESLASLKEAHARELEQKSIELEKSQQKAEAHDNVFTQLQTQHEQSQKDASQANAKLQGILEDSSLILGKKVSADSLPSHLQTTLNARKDIAALHETATNELLDVRAQLDTATVQSTEMSRKLEEMRAINEETIKELERVSVKEKKSSKLVEELEEQLNSNFDQHKVATHRLSALQNERHAQLETSKKELEEAKARATVLEAQLADAVATRPRHRESLDPRDAELDRSNSTANPNAMRKSSVSAVSLPSPPPAIPLPPLPNSPLTVIGPQNGIASNISPPTSRHTSKDISATNPALTNGATAIANGVAGNASVAATNANTAQLIEDQEARIRTIEKHLFAEKQLTATLEEALTDLESSSTKMKGEMEGWRRKCLGLEDEVASSRKQRESSRLSVQQLEEERDKRKQLEAQQARLEARLTALANVKKKKGSLACF